MAASASNGNGTARWQLWLSAATVGLTLMGSIFFLYQTATDALGRARELDAKVAQLEAVVADHTASLRVVRSDLREVETQFRAADQIRNLTHATDMRIQAMLWRKTFGAEYPVGNAYYPQIAREPPP